jgi:hypothetical protein
MIELFVRYYIEYLYGSVKCALIIFLPLSLFSLSRQ